MKKTIIFLIAMSLLITANLYALDGNLIVEGDATMEGNASIGTSSSDYRLTVQGANGDGLAILNQNGDVVTLFDRNATGEGRFKLFDSFGNELIKFVAGGSGSFKGTTVDFWDNSGNSMFKVNADTGSSYFENGNVGIGTTTPQSRLAVSGLPNSAPVSGTSYIVCVDPGGNFWVDNDGNNDCQ